MRRIIIASILAVLPACVAAAELPRKTAAPRDAKVIPCPAYGAGFVKVEGSTTCIKLGSSVRIETGRSR
jgi:hypothetical protein